MEFNDSQTKQCLFCAETIQSEAIKCRFCGEFLSTNRAKATEADSSPDTQSSKDEEQPYNVLFEGRPSLWAMAGAVLKSFLLLAVAIFLIVYPLEELSVFQSSENLAPDDYQKSTEGVSESELTENPVTEQPYLKLTEKLSLRFSRYRIILGIGLTALVVLILLLKIVRLKMVYYEVTPDRIEFSRGILDRRVDNLDMFRVVDLKLRRTLLDCVVGVGTVSLITTDKTDPEFNFEKVHNVRKLYDVIKKASLKADQKRGVIHLE